MASVSEEEVMTLASSMRLPKKREKLVLLKQVEWRLNKRIIILKWTKFPTDLVYHVLSYIGNESERESLKEENKQKHKRKCQLGCFKVDSDFWVSLTEQMWVNNNPSIIGMRISCERRLRELASEMSPRPRFPWGNE